jgi:hypothetical protein
MYAMQELFEEVGSEQWSRTRPHDERPQKLYPLADFPSPNVLDKAIISESPTIQSNGSL